MSEAEIQGPQGDQEFVQEAKEEAKEEKAEAEQIQEKHSSIRQRLERERAKKTVDLDVDGIDVPFRPAGTGVSRQIIKIGTKWNSMDDDMEVEEIEEQIDTNVEELTEILDEHSIPDDLDAEFWENTYGIGEIITLCNELAQSGMTEGVDADDVKNSQ